jgi:uncharacterized membrane protein YphA (DoxX/SURF4 family)
MNIALWIVQILLAVMFGMAGFMKTFQTAKAHEMLPWARNRSDQFVRFIGVSELLGALGIILPVLTGILPWLSPLAAIGLAVIQMLAIFTEHLPKKEYKVLPMNVVLLALALLVVLGRWSMFPAS